MEYAKQLRTIQFYEKFYEHFIGLNYFFYYNEPKDSIAIFHPDTTQSFLSNYITNNESIVLNSYKEFHIKNNKADMFSSHVLAYKTKLFIYLNDEHLFKDYYNFVVKFYLDDPSSRQKIIQMVQEDTHLKGNYPVDFMIQLFSNFNKKEKEEFINISFFKDNTGNQDSIFEFLNYVSKKDDSDTLYNLIINQKNYFNKDNIAPLTRELIFNNFKEGSFEFDELCYHLSRVKDYREQNDVFSSIVVDNNQVTVNYSILYKELVIDYMQQSLYKIAGHCFSEEFSKIFNIDTEIKDDGESYPDNQICIYKTQQPEKFKECMIDLFKSMQKNYQPATFSNNLIQSVIMYNEAQKQIPYKKESLKLKI